MQSASWIALLQRIPAAQQENLLLVTTAGTQIAIQSIFRLEADYVVIRGRLAATTETGRIFFIPYDQLNHVCFHKEVKEALIREFYGEPEPYPVPAQATEESGSAPPADAEPVPELIDEPAAPPEAAKPETRLPIPSRSGIIARLRARTAAAAGQASPPKP